MKLSFKEKILIIILAVVVVLFGGIKVLVSPAYAEYKTSLGTLLVKALSQNQARNDVTNASNISGNKKSSLDKANKAASAILPSIDTDNINVWLCGMANAKGLTVSQINFSTPVSTDIGGSTASNAAQAGTASQATASYKLGDYMNTYNGTSSVTSPSSPSAPSAKSPPSAASPSSATAQQPTAEGALLALPVTMAVTGTPANVTAFLDAVKATGKTAVVSDFTLTSGGATISVVCYGTAKPDGSDTYFAWSQPAPAGKHSVM